MRRPARTAAGGIMYLWKGNYSWTLDILSTPKILDPKCLDSAAAEMANKAQSIMSPIQVKQDVLQWHARAVLEKWSRDAA
jgi:hypothetical protein